MIRRLTLGSLALVSALVACTHDGSFSSPSYAPDVPRETGALVQLTFNLGVDLSPVWLPDGSGFLYTRERTDRLDRDRCLALLPAKGGSIERQLCDSRPAADDSINAFTSAAVSPDGRLAYVRASAALDVGWPVAPRYHELVLAPWGAPDRATVLLRVPYPGPSGRSHEEVAQLQWLDDSSLVYVGQHVAYVPPCRGCPLDTLTSGLEIARLDLNTPSLRLTMLPGSDQASSVTVVAPDTVYLTVNGDSRVFRLALSTGSLAVVHDFGARGIVRDVQVVRGRLVAVVGGDVRFTTDSAIGSFQHDGGGTLVLVDLGSGTETGLTPAGLLFRHPALAPSGTAVVAELVLGRTTDLWLLELP
jgi:hypothetical protein